MIDPGRLFASFMDAMTIVVLWIACTCIVLMVAAGLIYAFLQVPTITVLVVAGFGYLWYTEYQKDRW